MRREGNQFEFDGLGALLAALVVAGLVMCAPLAFFAIRGDRVGFAVSVAVLAMLFLGLLVMGAVADISFSMSLMCVQSTASNWRSPWVSTEMESAASVQLASPVRTSHVLVGSVSRKYPSPCLVRSKA